MSVKVISYDLGKPETSQSYAQLIDAIKNLGNWAKPLESFWLVSCEKSCTDIRDLLKPYLDSNDRLFVATIPLDAWATYNLPRDVTDWMNSH